MKDIIPQNQAAQCTVSRINQKKTACRPIIIKLLKTIGTDKIFKSSQNNIKTEGKLLKKKNNIS